MIHIVKSPMVVKLYISNPQFFMSCVPQGVENLPVGFWPMKALQVKMSKRKATEVLFLQLIDTPSALECDELSLAGVFIRRLVGIIELNVCKQNISPKSLSRCSLSFHFLAEIRCGLLL